MQARYVNKGETVTVKASAEIAYGDIVKVGDNLVGVSLVNITKGDTGTVAISGAFEVVKEQGALKQGQTVYYKEADKSITGTATDGTKIGVTLEAVKADAPTVVIKLMG